MRRVQTKHILKLRLLACVLALALLWYSLNPAPGTVIRQKSEPEPSDEKKRNAVPRNMPMSWPEELRPAVEDSLLLSEEDDDFEWPEYIDG